MTEEENPYGGDVETQGDVFNQDSTNLMNDVEFDFSVSNPQDDG
jgi:hypothetical protein